MKTIDFNLPYEERRKASNKYIGADNKTSCAKHTIAVLPTTDSFASGSRPY